MTWESPSFVEIDMSAEIGAYQGDDSPPYVGEDAPAEGDVSAAASA